MSKTSSSADNDSVFSEGDLPLKISELDDIIACSDSSETPALESENNSLGNSVSIPKVLIGWPEAGHLPTWVGLTTDHF